LESRSETLRRWDTLPRRLFLDTSLLQTLHEYGAYLYEDEPFEGTERILKRDDAEDELTSLQQIFSVADRGEFALSAQSLAEVGARLDRRFLQFAYDVLDHWEVVELEAPSRPNPTRLALIDGPSFGYLSIKDKQLVRDAVERSCDGFLTMEKRLPRNADDIYRRLGLQVMKPSQFWAILSPFAALFR
jgi:hypothetical protein